MAGALIRFEPKISLTGRAFDYHKFISVLDTVKLNNNNINWLPSVTSVRKPVFKSILKLLRIKVKSPLPVSGSIDRYISTV